jgi:hypothetical protein
MIEAIMGVGSGKSFSSVENPSAVLPLEIYSEISSFLMATHPLEMVNHPEEDSIRLLLRIIKTSISVMDLDRVLFCLALSLRQASVLSFRFLFFFILMRRRI